MQITIHHPNVDAAMDAMGIIPTWLAHAPALMTAKEALDSQYQHGGGWRPFEGFKLAHDNSLKYPGDPTINPIASIIRGDETICIYPHAWVAIIQPDRSFEVCRMD